MAAENGGGAFVLLFLLVILLVGAPALMAEMALGRRTRRNPVDAFAALRPRSPWALAGGLGVLASFVIFSYYSVIAGWVLAYALMAVRGDLAGLAVDAVTSDLLLPLGGLLTAVFVGWVWGIEPALKELRAGSPGFRAARLWAVSVRVVIPVTVAGVLAAGLTGVR
jgi:SNF family Na+-dependent transporter